MTELNEEHFELHSANKARQHEKKKMKNMKKKWNSQLVMKMITTKTQESL